MKWSSPSRLQKPLAHHLSKTYLIDLNQDDLGDDDLAFIDPEFRAILANLTPEERLDAIEQARFLAAQNGEIQLGPEANAHETEDVDDNVDGSRDSDTQDREHADENTLNLLEIGDSLPPLPESQEEGYPEAYAYPDASLGDGILSLNETDEFDASGWAETEAAIAHNQSQDEIMIDASTGEPVYDAPDGWNGSAWDQEEEY
jgi:hypothetical protein